VHFNFVVRPYVNYHVYGRKEVCTSVVWSDVMKTITFTVEW